MLSVADQIAAIEEVIDEAEGIERLAMERTLAQLYKRLPDVPLPRASVKLGVDVRAYDRWRDNPAIAHA